jgi:hypothetical protein
LTDAFNDEGMDITFENKWYTKDQFIGAFGKYMKDSGVSDDDISTVLASASDVMFPTITGTINGDIMTLNVNGKTETFTKNGGSTGPGTKPGTGGGDGWTTVAKSTFGEDGENEIHAIAYGNGKFVAGGWNGKMAYSSDNGVTWTAVANSTFGDTYIYTIAYGNDKFVAGGNYGKMAYSSDGVTWTAVANSTFGNSGIEAIAYGNGKFVAGGSNGKMAWSTDGTTWTAVSNSTFGSNYSDRIYAIAYGDGKFVAGGSGGKMATSTDGTTWTAVADSTFGGNSIYAIAYGNGKFVAVGDKRAYSSDNGVTWTASKSSSDRFYSIAYGNNKFITVGSGSIIESSPDGINWTSITTTAFNILYDLGGTYYPIGTTINAIAYGNGKFVAGGDYKLAYSTGY